jgi:hypothetical protein
MGFEEAPIGLTIVVLSRRAKPHYCCVGPSQYMTADIRDVPDTCPATIRHHRKRGRA